MLIENLVFEAIAFNLVVIRRVDAILSVNN